MIKIDVKPMTVNRAYTGRRFRTKEYRQYENDVLRLLPKLEVPDGDLCITYEFGFSSKGQDYDGAIKQIQDILQKVYNFNDNRIYEAHIYKKIVPKGQEYIKFDIKSCN